MHPILASLVRIEAALAWALRRLARVGLRVGLLARALVQQLVTQIQALPQRMKAALSISALVIPLLAGLWALRDGPINWYEANFHKRPLLLAKSWHYHLDNIDVETIQRNDADLVVMDYAKSGGDVPLTKDDVARIKTRRDGSKRLVVSYLSIGEAETYRWYWQKAWDGDDTSKRPSWLVAPNCAWPGAWSVKFWEQGWRDLVYAGAQSYLKRIIDAGFDGVYLDRVDIFEQFAGDKSPKDARPKDVPANPEAVMADFVVALAATARRLKPGFLVIPQNGEPLLNYRHYRRQIDGLGKEDLLFGHKGTGERNPHQDVAWSYDYLKKLLADHKPVFAVEYLVTKDSIAYTSLELERLGLVPTFQDRSLDGTDPTMPRIVQKLTEGTPEWIKTMCNTSNSW